jgi:1-acyl-sn-glycerol-3-phosphate acyltransferase
LHGLRREQLVSRWSAHVLRILNVKLTVSGTVPTSETPTALFVANHISWIDIWAINTVRTVRFVAKSEVRSWPVIGWLSEKAGVIFIERARRIDTSRVSGAGANALRQGHCLCVFPEGTTSDGTHIYPFRSSLLQSAVDAGAPVWPITLRYPLPDGSPNTAIAYAGETSMAESMTAILSQQQIHLHLEFADPIHPEGRDRRELARHAEAIIASAARLQVREAPEILSDLPA